MQCNINTYLIIFQNALKSCKQQAKNLADMTKELEAIERVTSPGDLLSRLEAAENSTVDVEKRLAKTVRSYKRNYRVYIFRHNTKLYNIKYFYCFRMAYCKN